MHERPDYRLAEFDALLTVLDEIPDESLRAEIRDALGGRELDVEALAEEHNLPRYVIDRLDQLQWWGDEDLSESQPFGSIRVATVSGASSAGGVDYVAHIFACRDAGRIVYSMTDDAGGDLELGESVEPMTLGEMIQLVDRFLAENAPWPTDPSDSLAGYFDQDREFDLRVHSTVYPDLQRWYREMVREWLAAHPEHE
jgi:hypothetical protein